MKTYALLPVLFAAVQLGAAACAPPSERDCEVAEGDDLSVAVNNTTALDEVENQFLLVTANKLGADLVLSGTAHHDKNLAIHTLTIGGIPVSSDKVNYATWTATIPANVLGQVKDGDTVTLPIVARDTCDREFDATLKVTIEAELADLSVVTEYNADSSKFIPASGTSAAVLVIAADEGSVGATVTVSAPENLVVDGLVDGHVVLQADDGRAAARVVVRANAKSEPETKSYSVSVSSHGQTATADVAVAGPPRFFPDSATIGPGDSVSILVDKTGGTIDNCESTSAADIVVTTSAKPDGDVAITVTADSAATTSQMVTVTCWDEFAQQAIATVVLAP